MNENTKSMKEHIDACCFALKKAQKELEKTGGVSGATLKVVFAAMNGVTQEDVDLILQEGENEISFGKWYRETEEDMEPIEWIVLERQGDTALLVTKYAIDCLPYNREKVDITWEECDLRKWLNNDFLNAAFTEEEKAMVQESRLKNEDNPIYGTKGGNATKDKVFLLSFEEAQRYFLNDKARQCIATPYAVANEAYVNDDWKSCWWWLRSPGIVPGNAAYVSYVGSLYRIGYSVNYGYVAVRPAMWVCRMPCHPASTQAQKRGRWVYEKIDCCSCRTYCSECGEAAPFICVADDHFGNEMHGETRKTRFCPNCGADMRGEQDE